MNEGSRLAITDRKCSRREQVFEVWYSFDLWVGAVERLKGFCDLLTQHAFPLDVLGVVVYRPVLSPPAVILKVSGLVLQQVVQVRA